MPEWLQRLIPEGWTATDVVWLSVGIFIVSFFGSLLLVGYILVKLPPDYYLESSSAKNAAPRHPIIRWTLRILKNILGIILILLGIVMSLPGVPGQGLLTIFIGIMFVDFPGSDKVEKWILRRRGVLNAINKLRAKYHKEPLLLE